MAASNQVAAFSVEHIKIISDTGQVHEPAQVQCEIGLCPADVLKEDQHERFRDHPP